MSVLNIEPNHLKPTNSNVVFKYDFLDFLNDSYNIDIVKYYNYLNGMEIFKLKNIYNYLYLRTYKINQKIGNTNILKKCNGNLSHGEMNQMLTDFINKDKLKSIIIMNGIQLYFTPILDS